MLRSSRWCIGVVTVVAFAAGSCELQRPVTPRLGNAVLLVGSTQAPPPPTVVDSPSTYPVLSQNPLDALNALGWKTSDDEGGLLGVANVLGTLLGGSTVLQFTFPAGFAGGKAPSTEYLDLPSVTHFYASISWEASANWQGHDSDVNKLAFVYLTGNAGDVALEMYGPPGGPYDLRTALELVGADKRFFLVPNIKNLPVAVGSWHQIEWQIQYNTTTNPANGVVRWWMDGTLLGEYTDVLFPANGITEYQISPTWGGVGDVKKHTDYFWYANALLAGY